MSAIPNTAAAIEWIKERGREFEHLDKRILDSQHAAAVWTGAQAEGSAERAAGRASVEAFGALLRAHQTALNRWDLLVPDVPELHPGALGAIPILVPVIAAAVIALAASMAWIFGRVTAEENTMRALRAGEITAEQAIQLTENIEGPPSVFGAPNPATMLLLVGGAGLAFYLSSRR